MHLTSKKLTYNFQINRPLVDFSWHDFIWDFQINKHSLFVELWVVLLCIGYVLLNRTRTSYSRTDYKLD
jgi:hypothetical protein